MRISAVVGVVGLFIGVAALATLSRPPAANDGVEVVVDVEGGTLRAMAEPTPPLSIGGARVEGERQAKRAIVNEIVARLDAAEPEVKHAVHVDRARDLRVVDTRYFSDGAVELVASFPLPLVR